MRPSHLPDYKSPPLNEVVLGVQFEQPSGYRQIRAGEVWALYKQQYPLVDEQPPLQPVFETFGGRPNSGLQFGFTTSAVHDRFWFLSETKDELIQFQADRLLHNWRKVGDGTNPYPRFEKMIEKFKSELLDLESYFANLATQKLAINQCEISYINHIVAGEKFDPSAWLRFLTLPDSCRADEVTVSVRRVLHDAESKPFARLFVDAATGFNPQGEKILVLTLTVRGTPRRTSIDDAIKFICAGRETIVSTFADVTTDAAQKVWERIQ